MKKVLKLFLILLIISAVLGTVWYFLIYRTDVTSGLFHAYADFCAEHGHYEAAARYYGRSASNSPDNLELCNLAAEAYEQCGNYTKAEYYLTLACNYHPNDLNTYVALSALFVRENKLLDAEKLIENCSDSMVKSELQGIRPASPVIQPSDTYFVDPISCTLSFSGGTAYVSLTDDFPSTETGLYTDAFLLDYGITTVTAVVVGNNGLVSKVTQENITVCGEIKDAEFSDASLEALVRSTLGKSAHASISTYEVWQISELTVPADVTDIQDLSMLLGLETLELDGQKDDYTVLSSLPKLSTLTIADAALDNTAVSAVAACSGLEQLNISGCGITSVDDLAALQCLNYLDISDNSIRDITSLAGLSELETLYAQNNSFDSISALAALPSLKILNVSGNRITSLGALTGNNILTELYASGCSIADISPLDGKTTVITLDLSDNRLTELSALSSCTSLNSLNISGNRLTDLSPITALQSLEDLDASDNILTECPIFPDGCGLLSLNLSSNMLTDVDGLTELESLHTLVINHNYLVSLDKIADLSSLVRVDAYENPILSVEALEARSIVVNYDKDYGVEAEEETDSTDTSDDSPSSTSEG